MRGRHAGSFNKIFDGSLNVDDFCLDLKKRADEKKNSIQTIILSDEDISMRRDFGVLARFQEHFDVNVIYSLRRQDLWLESWYLQNIKFQWIPKYAHITFSDFMRLRHDFHWIHYDQHIKMIENHFGHAALRLSVFEKSQMPEGPVAAFAKTIGIDDVSEFTPAPHDNASFSAQMAEIARHLPLDTLPPGKRTKMLAKLHKIDAIMPKGTGSHGGIMPLDDRRAILDEYSEGNRAVAQKYFEREALFIDPLPERDATLASLELPKDTSKILEIFVAPLILELAEDLP
ncbi:hypothetical protein [Rhodalgimonas zhirmunskyi]|nr:hypothetical protein [Rhodoalgimonas zhirmunskyi]